MNNFQLCIIVQYAISKGFFEHKTDSLCDSNEIYVEMKWKIFNGNVKKKKKKNRRKLVKYMRGIYLYKICKLSRKSKISDSDLCGNELSDLEDDEKRSVEKILGIMKTWKLYQFEPE